MNRLQDYTIITKSLIIKTFIFLAAFLAFLTLEPFFVWGNKLKEVVGCVYITYFFLIAAKYNVISRKDIKVAFFTIFLILLYSFRYDEVYKILYSFLFLCAVLVPFVLLINEIKLKIYDWFIKIIAISYIPAIIVAFLLLLGIDLSWDNLISYSASKSNYRQYLWSANYAVYYGFSEQYFFSYGGSIDRICAMFNEPGVVGTVSALILISKKLKLGRLYEKIILIAGILSLSMAFYTLIGLYLLIKNKKHLILFFIAYILLFSFTPKDSYLYNRILYRFEINSEGLAGNNRTNEGFEYVYKDFKAGNIKEQFLGIGEKEYFNKALNYKSEALSWKTFMVINGYLLFILHVLFFLYLCLKEKNKASIIFAVFYFMAIYQRPFDFSLGYWLIFFAGILYSLNKEENTVDNKSLSRGNVNEEKSIICN
ncbi:TPA: polymerase [Bacillus thuringiensis]|uniref:polymerase n=1 Tax=Bacillus TaxID=1386 RepID=UPI0009137CC0|nr:MULTISPECIES: polymerase [Bacillus]MCU4844593.1 polymerase [Bacillus cereus]MDA2461359.1 polymerase [Bacillus cereus]MED3265113.1 polymerase [Bacillus thuringiensis]PEA61881.1 polymerase [Bacillus thuringiensis]PES32731.1 polymerase [Bacillus cereus]